MRQTVLWTLKGNGNEKICHFKQREAVRVSPPYMSHYLMNWGPLRGRRLCRWGLSCEYGRRGLENYWSGERPSHSPRWVGGVCLLLHPSFSLTHPTVPGPDIWDRSTCPWESFSEEGLSSPDDIHGNKCRTSATGHFFCKHCKNPHGYHPMTLWGKVKKGQKRKSWMLTCAFWIHINVLGHSAAPLQLITRVLRKSRNYQRCKPPTWSIQLGFPRWGRYSKEFTADCNSSLPGQNEL